jgi:hypothetical protein
LLKSLHNVVVLFNSNLVKASVQNSRTAKLIIDRENQKVR